MSEKLINRLVAVGVFLAAVIVYLKTLSVTVVFWDVGEFCAASRLLEIPHPPGSPLFLFLARVASLIPFREDLAARMHTVSAIGSAIGVMFLYLVAVKVIIRFRGDIQSAFDRIVVYGASAIGALALAYSSTYWDNSIEAEVYGMAMFFVSICLWLALRWWDKADEARSERYILLIAYLLGLSTGVHILALLTIIPILMIFYFRRYELTRKSVIRFAVVALLSFFIVYPGVVQIMPSFLDGEIGGMKSDLFPFIPLALIIAAGYGVYRAVQTKQKMLQIACAAFLFVVLGYTTYTQVLIRANVDNLPMKENDPSNLQHLTSYLTREQYGQTPQLKGESWNNETQSFEEKLFPRRWSREAMHEPTRANYTSDWDFFWRYQVNHMFTRYVLWNFVGSEGDWQDAGVSWKETWGIPFLLALFGTWYHFKKEWKIGLVFLVTWVIMGIVLDLYQNQQDPQPRERDYFYVGAYYCMALWIAVGVVGIADFLKAKLADGGALRTATSGVLVACALAIPVNLARVNWHTNNRSGIFIAWDYSYNLLQSCEKDALLVTNGDNDTFPLWYLQDVEGIRTDVRIVNLSLVNTPWYAKQLKNETPHGAKKVAMSISDEQLERLQPVEWRPRQVDVPVPKNVAAQFGITETQFAPADSSVARQGKISFRMEGVPYGQGIRILRIQDMIVRDIILSNKWERPIYFAATCSPDSKIGLDPYLWMEGMAFKLRPNRVPSADGGTDYERMLENTMAKDVVPVRTPQRGYRYRNLNNPDVYYDENVQRMVINYRLCFLKLADYALRVRRNIPQARSILTQMEETIPITVIPLREWRMVSYLMNMFHQAGDNARFELYAGYLESEMKGRIDGNRVDSQDPFLPFRELLGIYDVRKDYKSALDILHRAEEQFGGSAAELKPIIQSYEQKLNSATLADTSKK